MQAYTYSRYGGPDVLKQVSLPKPEPAPDEVIVRIRATTVTSADGRLRSLSMPPGLGWMGRPAIGVFGPRKPILGTEFSGIVDAIGRKVTNFEEGDAVVGFPGSDLGAHAQFIAMPADGRLVRKPVHMSFESAAAIPFGATAAYDFLVNKAQVQAGETVLINGASGSVGCACIQIAKRLGARITAVCSAANADLVRGLGADDIIDYQTTNFAETGRQYDIIVDTAGTASWKVARNALRPNGRLLLISINGVDLLFGDLKARRHGQRCFTGGAAEDRRILDTVVAFYADNGLEPVIGKRFAFDDMVLAHEHVDTGRKVGNTVVTMPI